MYNFFRAADCVPVELPHWKTLVKNKWLNFEFPKQERKCSQSPHFWTQVAEHACGGLYIFSPFQPKPIILHSCIVWIHTIQTNPFIQKRTKNLTNRIFFIARYSVNLPKKKTPFINIFHRKISGFIACFIMTIVLNDSRFYRHRQLIEPSSNHTDTRQNIYTYTQSEH